MARPTNAEIEAREAAKAYAGDAVEAIETVKVKEPVATGPRKLNPNKIIEAMKGMELVLNDIDDNVLIMRNPASKVQLAVNLNNHADEDAVVALFAYNGIGAA